LEASLIVGARSVGVTVIATGQTFVFIVTKDPITQITREAIALEAAGEVGALRVRVAVICIRSAFVDVGAADSIAIEAR